MSPAEVQKRQPVLFEHIELDQEALNPRKGGAGVKSLGTEGGGGRGWRGKAKSEMKAGRQERGDSFSKASPCPRIIQRSVALTKNLLF